MLRYAEGDSPLDAWRSAVDIIVASAGCELQDLVVGINEPSAIDDSWLKQFDPRPHGGKDNPSDVANTIFPTRTWKNSQNRSEFYERYTRAHSRSQSPRWGTYFLRLINFGDPAVNQLEAAIHAISDWKNTPKSAICFHLASPHLDSLVPLGSPCLQAIQLHVSDTIDFSVFYRNHDYFNKALPNFIGLGRLLAFVAEESGKEVGRIVCYSTHAYGKSKKALNSLRDS
jgi:thymidylate synthase